MHRALLLVALVAGCSQTPAEVAPTPDAAAGKPPTKKPAVAQPPARPVAATSSPSLKVAAQSAPKRKPAGTGVAEQALLAAVNAKGNPPADSQHDFVYVKTVESMRQYADKKSGLKLTLAGPSDDLESIDLAIHLPEFPSVQAQTDAAGALGRGVRSIGFAVDPNWGEVLYDWMHRNMAAALLTPGGIQTNHRHVAARFQSEDPGNGTTVYSITIGVPTQEEPRR